MSQPTLTTGGSAPSRFATLVALAAEVHAELAELVAGGVVAELSEAALPELAVSLARSIDRGQAVTTALVGRVDVSSGRGGSLVAGVYPSTRRWLEARAGMSGAAASAVLARARDLREHSGVVAEAWLEGQVTGDAVRELTVGISDAMRRLSVPDASRAEVRAEALRIAMPVARVGSVADLRKAVERLRFVLDPDGATQAAMDAYDDQRLTCTRVGSMTRIEAWLTHEGAAATMTVVDRIARRLADSGAGVEHTGGCDGGPVCTCGARVEPSARPRARWSHLQAVALTEVMTGLLSDAVLGSHHRVAPHLTVVVDLEQAQASLGSSVVVGELALPGHDEPALLPEASVRRLLCDSEVTRVLTRRTAVPSRGPGDPSLDAVAALLESSREVLYVGRAERVVTARLRRALETRDRHCAFPGCRAHVRRCHAHHVVPWEHGGPTDIANLAMLCVRHHHAVHEGGWRMSRAAGVSAHGSGCWEFDPPPRRAWP